MSKLSNKHSTVKSLRKKSKKQNIYMEPHSHGIKIILVTFALKSLYEYLDASSTKSSPKHYV